MAFSDIEKEKDKARSKNRAIDAGSNFRWSDAQKLEAVKTMMVLGNLALTSRLLGIPEITIRVWKATAWWKELSEELRLQERIELSASLKKIVKAAHVQVEDRLVNGDVILNQKTGKLVRKPVNLRDAAAVAVQMLNQVDMVEKGTKEADTPEQDSNKLDKLAERFAEFATQHLEKKMDNKRTVQMADIVDVEESKNPIHD